MLLADRQTAAAGGLSPEQVIITPGSNQLLYLVAVTLCDPGDVVLCGAPSYYVFLGMLEQLGIQAVGVQTDSGGLMAEALDRELASRHAAGELARVKAVYITSFFDNPTGISVEPGRRAALVEIVQRWSSHSRIYLIEDAAYRELRYYGDDVPSLRARDPAGETVIHAGTFSKSFSPGLRVGWGVLPRELVGPVVAQKGNIDFGSPSFNQVLLSTVLEEGWFDAHVEHLRAVYRRKLDATLAALDQFVGPVAAIRWERPTGGLYVWVRLPEEIDTGLSGPLFDRAVAEGVLYLPGECCFAGPSPPKNLLRVSFGVPDCESIVRGIEALGRAIRAVLR